MAWVRIHDGAMTHPKVVGLSDKAFRLWVWGLSYAQQHLTDGLLLTAAIPSRVKRATADLIRVSLWEAHDVGFKIHDYLDWNDSRDVVMAKRDGAKTRLQDFREKRAATPSTSEAMKRVSLLTSATALARSGVGVKEGSVHKKEEEKNFASSKRPIFSGQRFAVFEWQLDGLSKLLGPHVEDFDLHAWFFALDERVVKSAQLVPQRDNGAWLLAQTQAEATRRGLVMADAIPIRDHVAERQADGETLRRLLREEDARDAALGIKDGKFV